MGVPSQPITDAVIAQIIAEVDTLILRFGKSVDVFKAKTGVRNRYGQAVPDFDNKVTCTGRVIFNPTMEQLSIIGDMQDVDIAVLFSREELVRKFPLAAATLLSSAETFALSDGQTLLVKVDGGAVQIVTFVTADFVAVGAATAAEVATRITTDLTGASAVDFSGQVSLTSDTLGNKSRLEVTGGTANGALGFSTSVVLGAGTENEWITENDEIEFEGYRFKLLKAHPTARLKDTTILYALAGRNLEGNLRQ
jgi:hypothetical protein